MNKANAAIAVSPLHAWHISQGARFADVDGWRVPGGYSNIADESNAARTGLALADISWMAKLSVRDRTIVSTLTGPSSQQTVAALSDSQNAWACRLSPDHCLMLSASGQSVFQARLQKSPACKPELLFDVTCSYAGFALFGPNHARVLRGLTSFDIDLIASPGSCAETGLAGVHAILVRPPGSAAAIQIYVGWDVGEFVCERIVEAAGANAVVPLGIEALKQLWRL